MVMNKKALLLAVAALLLVAALPKEEPGEICQDSIEGFWTEPDDSMWTWEFRNSTMTVFRDGKRHNAFKYRLDSSRSPMTFHLAGYCHGIVAIDGNAMKIFTVPIDVTLPADFTPNSKASLFVLKRKPR